MTVPVLCREKSDILVWKNKANKECKFSVKEVYRDLRSESNELRWTQTIWYTQCIPKHSFILWLAVQKKLLTHDGMAKWGSYDLSVCALCMEYNHLFFQCKYAAAIWEDLKLLMQTRIVSTDWNSIVYEMADNPCGNSIWSVVRRLGLAACVYFIWQERNRRIFKDEKRDWKVVLERIVDTVRLKMMSLKVKKSSAVEQVSKEWGIELQV